MKKMRIGVIGVGSISAMHIRAYQKNNRAELAAFADINQERLKEKAALYGVPAVYTDYRAMLERENLDAVSICTWNNVHAEAAIAALEHGVNVLCEKPLTMTNEEADAVAKAAQASGKTMMVGFVRRSAENTQMLKRFIDAGDIGDIYYAKLNCFRRIGNPGGWFADIGRSGGGPMIDLGVHLIDAAWYLMGKPRPVSVSANTYHKLGNFSNITGKSHYKAADYSADQNSVEDLANALFRFENGASMMVDVSYSLHTASDTISAAVFGERGGCVLEPSCKVFLEKHNALVDVTPYVDHPSFDFDGSFQTEIDNFIRICHGEMENYSPVEDGVAVMRMLCGVYASAASRKEILL